MPARSDAPPHVLSVRYSFEMPRVDAARNATEVIQFESAWNIATEQRVSDPVRPDGSALDLNVSVTPATDGSEP